MMFLTALVAAVMYSDIAIQTAPQQCGKHNDILARLESKYQEVPAALGATMNGSLIEITVSPAGTWTIMEVTGAMSCIRAAGDGWTVKSKKEGKGI